MVGDLRIHVVRSFAARLVGLWAVILLVEVGFHFYMGSRLPGAGIALTFYSARHRFSFVRLTDFIVPAVALGVCMGYWCLALSSRVIVTLTLLNWAALIAAQPLWLGLLPRKENWLVPGFPDRLAFIIEYAALSLLVMWLATSGVRSWEQRKRLPGKNGNTVGRDAPSAPSDNGGAK